MTDQEISDRSLLYQSMRHLIEDTEGGEWLCRINITWEDNEDFSLHVFPQKELHEVLTLGFEAYKKKHGETVPESEFWKSINAALDIMAEGKEA